MAKHVAGMTEMINTYKLLVGKPEGKKLLGRLFHCVFLDFSIVFFPS
jgi:hypothetical protein